VTDLHQELDQVKLYPPYPIDEPRRAAAIRQFNGVAAEVARLVPAEQLRALTEHASVAEASTALDGLEQARDAIARRRITLELRITDAGSNPDEAAARSQALRAELQQTGAGIVRPSSDLLRQVL
jgi:hypothetical protein